MVSNPQELYACLMGKLTNIVQTWLTVPSGTLFEYCVPWYPTNGRVTIGEKICILEGSVVCESKDHTENALCTIMFMHSCIF